jgi:hypothetical protein
MQTKFSALRTYCVSRWGPLLLGLEVLLREEPLSPRGVEMIGVLQRGVRKEAKAIEELLRSTELFEKDASQNR